mgnify:CR=1 FL=1
MLVGAFWGLGVWHRVLFRDLFARAEWSLDLRVTTGFRLRWLSERGRLDCAGTGLSGMLKWVPVWGGEGWWWPGCGQCSYPVAGMVTMLEVSCRSGLQAAIGVDPSAPGDALYVLPRRSKKGPVGVEGLRRLLAIRHRQ